MGQDWKTRLALALKDDGTRECSPNRRFFTLTEGLFGNASPIE